MDEGGRRKARSLSMDEIEAFVRRGYFAVLATSVNDQPYGVPIIYGYDERGVFYIANGPGRKIRNMEANPNVTITIVEAEDYGRRWRSVIASGCVEIVSDLSEKLHAFNTLRKQIPRPAARLSDAAKLASAKVVKLVPSEITGRETGF